MTMTNVRYDKAPALDRILAVAEGRLVEPVEAYSGCREIRKVSVLTSDEVTGPPMISTNEGDGNVVFCGFGSDVAGLRISFFGRNNVVFLGPHSRLAGHVQVHGDHALIFVGAFTTIGEISATQHGDGGCMFIGEDCMFANRITATNADENCIFDLETGEEINPNDDVFVDDHVWIAQDVQLDRGARIDRDTVVEQASLVCDALDSNCIYGGIPAQKIREGVNWSREARPTWAEVESSDERQTVMTRIRFMQDRIRAMTPVAGVR